MEESPKLVCGTHTKAKVWLSSDICGLVCAVLTSLFMIFATYVTHTFVLPPPFTPSFHRIGYSICMLLAFWSHIKTMLTDPGAVPENAVPLDFYDEERNGKYKPHHDLCRICKTYKPQTAHHCSVCERCVVRMVEFFFDFFKNSLTSNLKDHHCPWANNCIGQNNHKFFLLFIFYIFCACLWSIYLIMMRSWTCSQGLHLENHRMVQTIEWCRTSNGGQAIWQVLLGVEGFFFGIFTLCMICDQSTVVLSGQSHIDQFKRGGTTTKTEKFKWENACLIFGGDSFSLFWLLPTDPKWRHPSKVFGFRFRE